MLQNYLRTALRSLRRHPGFTAVNVIGLGVGIAVSTLLLLFVRSELAVNDIFPNAEHIYRIDTWHTDSDGSIRYIATNPVGKTIKQKAPGIEARTWVYGLWVTVGAEGDYYRARHLSDERRIPRRLRPATPARQSRDRSRRPPLRAARIDPATTLRDE